MYRKVLVFLLTVLVAMYALNNSPSPPKDSRPHTQGLLLLKICICISIGVWNLTILLDVGVQGMKASNPSWEGDFPRYGSFTSTRCR